jgi:putative NADH-flavin reductase
MEPRTTAPRAARRHTGPSHATLTLLRRALLILLVITASAAHAQSVEQPRSPAAMPLQVVIFGASGRVGSRITAEALARGHSVTAVSRDPARVTAEHPRLSKVAGDVMSPDSIESIVSGHDAVVSAIGGNNPDSDDPADSYPARAGRALVEALGRLAPSAPRLIIVGGGSTTLESSPGVPIEDPTDIPTGARGARILGHRIVLDLLQSVQDIPWTFASPALEMRPGERTGVFRTGGSVVIRDAQGISAISMEDFAVAIVDELERPQHLNAQMTVAY